MGGCIAPKAAALPARASLLRYLVRACVLLHARYGTSPVPACLVVGTRTLRYGCFPCSPLPRAPDDKVLAMQLLGNNVSAVRKRQVHGLLPFGAAGHICLQMMSCLEAVHAEGFLHRDVKPSNFVTSAAAGHSHGNQLFVLDFGQSRMYLDDRGAVRPPRPTADFRGTSLYSSLHAHEQRDLGRRDDLWSLFYVFVDMARGGLPWRVVRDDRSLCGSLKAYYRTRPSVLLEGFPGFDHLMAWHAHLEGAI